MAPRIAPNESPDCNSSRTTRHQSRKRTSPSAIARIINVEACDPELPPLEMIKGKNSASTTAFAISLLITLPLLSRSTFRRETK